MDENYENKLESLQAYIPFLKNMIAQLKDPNKKNREQQLNKMESLLSMITDKKRKLKLETLTRCEDVIIKLYEKVNPNKPLPIKSPSSTPASPSPPHELDCAKPVVIPTEKITSSSSGGAGAGAGSSNSVRLGHVNPRTHYLPKVDVYSSAGESLCKKDPPPKESVFNRLGTKFNRPPISIDDLKTLQDDVQDKLVNKSLHELTDLRKKLTKQIDLEEKKLRSPTKEVNTTMRNSASPVKKPPSNKFPPPEKLKWVKDPRVKPVNFTIKPKTALPPKVVKDSESVFGSMLSSIDEQILGGGKKKKEERRSSITKEPKLSEQLEQHIESKKLDEKKVEMPFKRLADKYNPKPRKLSVETVEIDKEVTCKIEESMRAAPVVIPTNIAGAPPLLPPPIPVPVPVPAPAVIEPKKLDFMSIPSIINNVVAQLKIQTNITTNPTPVLVSPRKEEFPTAGAYQNYPQAGFSGGSRASEFYPQTPRQSFSPEEYRSDMQPFNSNSNKFQQFNGNANKRQFGGFQQQQQPQHQNQNYYNQNYYHQSNQFEQEFDEAPQQQQFYPPEQNQFQHQNFNNQHAEYFGGQDRDMRQMWSNNSNSNRRMNNRDPRNYREYREMKESTSRNDYREVEQRDPRLLDRDPRTSRDPRDRNYRGPPQERSNRYDSYSSRRRARSKSRSRYESFTSPLDSLYQGGDQKTGKGYGVQSFRNSSVKVEKDVVEVEVEVEEKEEVVEEVKEVEEVAVVVEEKPAEVVKSDPVETVESDKVKKPEEEESNEKNILFKFFANLIGTENKEKKKGALLSLISTFSDSIGEKQIQRISNIIENDSDDEPDKKPEEKPKEKLDEEDEKPLKKTPKKRVVRRISSSAEREPELEEPPPVVESVGERIKNRRRVTPSPPKKKKCRTELDLLHEDIQDMFIRDGVLTASGKRMCRMLKDDPNALSPTKPARKKPGPKPKPKPSVAVSESDLKTMSNVRVVIAKIPQEICNAQEEKRRSLRRLSKKANYVETDEEEITTEKVVEKVAEVEQEEEEEEEEESVEEDKQQVEEQKKTVKRKRNSWASGVIKKKQKRKKLDDEAEPEKQFVEPDKNYYPSSKKTKCKLCNYSSIYMSYHYKNRHPEYEVLNSRLPPEAALEAVKDAKKNLDKYEARNLVKKFTRLEYKCRICNFTTTNRSSAFYDHVSLHTGEFRHSCNFCNYGTCNVKTLRRHFELTHADQPKIKRVITRKVFSDHILFGYMCGECNYVQINKEPVQEHVKIYHLSDVKVHKINMSAAPINDVVEQEDEEASGESAHSDAEPQVELTEDEEVVPPVKKRKTPSAKPLSKKVKTKEPPKRAAKEKAEAKLKEQSDILNSEERVVEPAKEEQPQKKRMAKTRAEEKLKEQIEGKNDEKEPVVNAVVTPPPVVPIPPPPPVNLNVFTCGNDMETDDAKIEQERMQVMEELSKTVGSRNSLNFVSELSNRLMSSEEVKQEISVIPDTTESIPDVPDVTMPVLEMEESEGRIKPTLTLETVAPQAPVDVSEKSNQCLNGILEKLQGVLSEPCAVSPGEVKDDDSMEERWGPPPLTHVADLQVTASEQDCQLVGGLVKVIKAEERLTYCCLVPPCAFSTEKLAIFEEHCKEEHQWLTSTRCKLCDVLLETPPVLVGLLAHLREGHHEFFAKPGVVIRMRRLSGDLLSVKDEIKNEEPVMDKPEPEPEEQVQDDDNPFPFKICEVMSLAEAQPQPPPLTPLIIKSVTPPGTTTHIIVKEAPLTPAELSKPRKTVKALAKFVTAVRDLYKCPVFECLFTSNVRDIFERHLKFHKDEKLDMVPCVYCDMKTPLEHVRMHMDIRHAHCRFACAFCCYRAVNKDYVVVHQDEVHSNRECSVICLPQHKQAKRFALADGAVKTRTLCKPFKCCNDEFLFEDGFKEHLNNHPYGTKVPCLFPKCTFYLKPSVLLEHWRRFHGICSFQCGLCAVSYLNLVSMHRHFALTHPNNEPQVLYRRGPPGLLYTDEAFKQMTVMRSFGRITRAKKFQVVPVQMQVAAPSLMELPASTSTATHHVEELEPAAPVSPEMISVSSDEASASLLLSEAESDPLSLEADEPMMDKTEESSPSSGEPKVPRTKVFGLMGFQLYRCICNESFSNLEAYRNHLLLKVCKRDLDEKPYECVHCGKLWKHPFRLIEHIQYHGAPRFTCSLCNSKFPAIALARAHMRTRHNLSKIKMTPLKSELDNLDTDEFVVRPVYIITLKAKPTTEELNPTSTEMVFTPEEMDKLPMRSIFSSEVRCAICQYATKVRTNLVRHLQFHLEEKSVPDTAPVNPVPCLDKNEKMFDKMTNLAFNSLTSRMGKPEKVDAEESEKLPDFVPTHCRYVCCAQDCNYLCPEEGNLRHHLIALHNDDTKFTCAHCKNNLTPTDADSLIKHFKLHGLHLYKCHYCKFVHHLRHKIEKHIGDSHLDQPVKVVTVRSLEQEAETRPQTPVIGNVGSSGGGSGQKGARPWRCCMCKARFSSLPDIQNHVQSKHELDHQFKCALCNYKTNEMDTFEDHFKQSHSGQAIDIIYVYRKVEDDPKTEGVESFDTTPLWQRDRPRVRHIRGILFDDITPPTTPVTKSPKKPKATIHLDQAIDAVASGTADILKNDEDEAEKVDVDELEEEEFADSEFSRTSLVQKFGRLGNPNKMQYKCPDCGEFRTRQLTHFVFHLFKDKNMYRYICKECCEPGITYAYMLKHVQNHQVNDVVSKITELPVDYKLEVWAHMVIHHQSNLILKKNPILPTSSAGDELCQYCNLSFDSPNKKHEHNLVHWSQKPYACSLCFFRDFTEMHIELHYNKQHPHEECTILSMAPSVMDLFKAEKTEAIKLLEVLQPQPQSQLASTSASSDLPIEDTNKEPEPLQDLEDEVEEIIVNEGGTNESNKVFFCDRCPEFADTQQKLRVHILAKHQGVKMLWRRATKDNKDLFQCSCCAVRLNEFELRKHHIQEHGNQEFVLPKISCQLCGTVMRTLRYMRAHFTLKHKGTQMTYEILNNAASLMELNPPKLDPEPDDTDSKDFEPADDSILTVTKSETVEDETDPNGVFFCHKCPWISRTKVAMADHYAVVHGKSEFRMKRGSRHSTDIFGCWYCKYVGNEFQLRQHHIEIHKEKLFIPTKVTCGLCDRKFRELSFLKNHFRLKHKGEQLSYRMMDKEGVQYSEPSKQKNPALLKRYNCKFCDYTTVCRNSGNIRCHVRMHFQPYVCNHCEQSFKQKDAHKYCNEITPNEAPTFTIDKVQYDEYTRELDIMVQEAVVVVEESEVPTATARKSTSKPTNLPKLESELDLKKIMTTVEVNKVMTTMTVEQLSHIFNLFPTILLTDCCSSGSFVEP